MDKVRLGRTDLMVTAVCFGTSGLGDMPDTYGYGVDEARARVAKALKVPHGYKVVWGGEFESAQRAAMNSAASARGCLGNSFATRKKSPWLSFTL